MLLWVQNIVGYVTLQKVSTCQRFSILNLLVLSLGTIPSHSITKIDNIRGDSTHTLSISTQHSHYQVTQHAYCMSIPCLNKGLFRLVSRRPGAPMISGGRNENKFVHTYSITHHLWFCCLFFVSSSIRAVLP